MDAPVCTSINAVWDFWTACVEISPFWGAPRRIWDEAVSTTDYTRTNQRIEKLWKNLTKRQQERILAAFTQRRLERNLPAQ
jgi:hypothetical protein